MKISELPIEIKELAEKRREEHLQKYPATMFSNGLGSAFIWNRTKEKHKFWSKINNGYFYEFYEWYPKKDKFILPEKWACSPSNLSERNILYEFIKSKGYDADMNNKVKYYHYPFIGSIKASQYNNLQPNYLQITFEQFNEFVLNKKQDKTMITGQQTVGRQQLEEIHKIACGNWKTKIENIVKERFGLFTTFVQLDNSIILEMFKAADSSQTKVLERIFQKPVEDKNAFKSVYDNKVVNALCAINKSLFDASAVIGIATVTHPEGRKELLGRSFVVPAGFNVITHNVYGNTVIEIQRK